MKRNNGSRLHRGASVAGRRRASARRGGAACINGAPAHRASGTGALGAQIVRVGRRACRLGRRASHEHLAALGDAAARRDVNAPASCNGWAMVA